MIESLISVLFAGLSLWNTKESRKYFDRTLKLERKFREESSKDRPDNAVLDNIEFELQLLSEAFSSKVKRSYSGDSK